VSTSGGQSPFTFQSQNLGNPIALPSGVWTVIAQNTNASDRAGIHPLNPSSTTIAAGSNTVALPTGTINVASTAGFPAASAAAPRCIIITGPPGVNTDTTVQYTGSTGTTFTGCTGGTGTMATGQTVKPANEVLQPTAQSLSGIFAALATGTFAAQAGGTRGIRFETFFFGVLQGVTTLVVPATGAQQALSVNSQPLVNSSNLLRYAMFQDSGSVVNSVVDGIEAPILDVTYLVSF